MTRLSLPIGRLSGVVFTVAACREPTQITLEVTTDVACGDVTETRITVGTLGEIETKPEAAATSSCDPATGRVGALVAVPADEGGSEVAFKVVSSIGVPSDACAGPDYGPDCIVARRALTYISHQPLVVPVDMRDACKGVACAADTTCVQGLCRPAQLDATACAAPEGCGEAALPPPLVVAGEPWAKRFGGPNTDDGYDVAVSLDGNVYATGDFNDETDFGGGPSTAQGVFDIYLASYRPDGSYRWSKRFGGLGADIGLGVAVDAGGRVHLTGVFADMVDFGGGPLGDIGVASQMVIASFDAGGQHSGSRAFGRASPQAIAAGPGVVCITGGFDTPVDLGGGVLVPADMLDAFVACYDDAGDHLWSKRVGAMGQDSGSDVAIDASGRVLVIGYFADELDFDSGTLASAGGLDAFVASFESDGTERWTKRFGDMIDDLGTGIGADGDGNVYVAGKFEIRIDLGGDLLATDGNTDAFLASFDADGVHRWSRRFGGAFVDGFEALALDGLGGLYAGGVFQQSAEFGGDTFESAGNSDIVLAGYDSDGTHRRSVSFGGSGQDQPFGLAAAAAGQLYATGRFAEIVDFGSASLTCAGPFDAWLVKTVPAEP